MLIINSTDSKYVDKYHFSKDLEEVVITVTAKRIGKSYWFEFPNNWELNGTDGIIKINELIEVK